jgi:hypothetical protein
MTFSTRSIVRLLCISGALAAVAAVILHAQANKPFLRIISPANWAVVRPGAKAVVSVTGEGEWRVIAVVGEVGLNALFLPPMGKPPWAMSGEIPLDTELGKTELRASGATVSGTLVDADPIEIDVEPAEIPPVTFSQPALVSPPGLCVRLQDGAPCSFSLGVLGTYADGTEVGMNRSSLIKFRSLSPSIAAVSQDGGALYGLAPGSTKLIVFDKYSIDVTVGGGPVGGRR